MSQTSVSQSMTIAIEGQQVAGFEYNVAKANGETSAAIPFGHGVKRGSGTEEVLLPTAESSVILGIVAYHTAYSDRELSSTGVLPDAPVTVMTKGRAWVVCDSGCTAGDRLWVRAVAGAGEALGALENADDSTDTVDCTNQGLWLTTASADGLALLDFDFTRE